MNEMNLFRKPYPIASDIFLIDGHTAFLMLPDERKIANSMPWVWYAPTLPGLPGPEEEWMLRQFMAAGIAVAGIDVGESYGSPGGRSGFSALYRELVHIRKFSAKPALLARSRGGLMHYNWAADHPTSVSCIAGIYPVCNLLSFPGLEMACEAYEMAPEQFGVTLSHHNPIDRLSCLADAGIPIFHMAGDQDLVVPLEPNSQELAVRYRRYGGDMTLRVVRGRGHDMWAGWFQCPELVDFVISHVHLKTGSVNGMRSFFKDAFRRFFSEKD